jgi:hypothetical protein
VVEVGADVELVEAFLLVLFVLFEEDAVDLGLLRAVLFGYSCTEFP